MADGPTKRARERGPGPRHSAALLRYASPKAARMPHERKGMAPRMPRVKRQGQRRTWSDGPGLEDMAQGRTEDGRPVKASC